MITLGVSAVGDDCAAAVAVDGAIVSAVDRAAAGGVQACVREAIELAGLELQRIDRVVATSTACTTELPCAADVVTSHDALAAQARAFCGRSSAAVIVDDAADGSVAVAALGGSGPVAGGSPALATLSRVARALGVCCDRPVAALETVAMTVQASALPVQWQQPGGGASIDDDAVEALLEGARARTTIPLDAADTPHLPTQQARSAIAASVLESFATLVACAVEHAPGERDGTVGVAGDAFASPGFAARVRRRAPVTIAPVQGAAGEALGAALLPHADLSPLRTLAFGRAYSDQEIKATLDNCRLEYLYEPSWPRLLERTSQLLSTGALVGWFQGRADFGGVSFGSRSVLCDPSSRYSRENVNVFLLGRPAHAPLHLSFSPGAADSRTLRFEYRAASELSGPREKLVAAIDRGDRVLHHVPDPDAMPLISGLLHAHCARTGVPGLLNVPMMTNGTLTVTPRQAIRETFGSSTDALVIGRFVVAKDHWLLRR